MLRLALIVISSVWGSMEVHLAAAEVSVRPDEDLAERIAEVDSGTVLVLESGIHMGPIVIDKPLTLRGRPGATLDGQRKGSVISVRADDVRIEGLTIQKSGLRLGDDDAGIHSTGARTQVIGNRIESCLHGVYFREVKSGLIVDNRIIGATGEAMEAVFDTLTGGAPVANQPGLCAVAQLNENRRGNGIHLFSSSEVSIRNNRIARTRDGIYFSFADDCDVADNEVRQTRYGLHYMYSDGNRFHGNLFTDNAAGAALMYSGELEVRENDFSGNQGRRAYGLLLQSVDDSAFVNNRFGENTIGVYAENSQNNRFERNTLAANYIALRMGGSSRNNHVTENLFQRNLHSAEVSGHGDANEWSGPERGNRWQGAPAPDLDGDGVSEFVHREADLLGKLRKDFPMVAFLSGSPGLDAIRFAHSRGRIPGVPTITDPHPLTQAPQR